MFDPRRGCRGQKFPKDLKFKFCWVVTIEKKAAGIGDLNRDFAKKISGICDNFEVTALDVVNKVVA